jgi:opacity protein-like surface antigen
LQPYLLAGLGYMHAKVKERFDTGLGGSDGDFAMRVGGGVDFYLTDYLVFQVELGGVVPTRNISGLDQFTFATGLQARF